MKEKGKRELNSTPFKFLRELLYSTLSIDEAYKTLILYEESILEYANLLKKIEEKLKVMSKRNKFLKEELKKFGYPLYLGEKVEAAFYFVKDQLKKLQLDGKGNEACINFFYQKELSYIM